MKKYIIILLLLPMGVFAQSINGSVWGADQDGESALVGANLIWLNTGIGTITDAEGAFSLDFPDGIDPVLVVRFIGYTSDTIPVAGLETVRVVLESELLLGSVTVEGERNASSISTLDGVNKVTLNERELLKAACCNLSESFETNVTVDAEFSDAVTGARTIRMLGLDGIYAQILVNGIPAVRGLSSGYGLSYIPGTWLESIQITKGPGSVESGYEGISGLINARTKAPGPKTADRLFLNAYGNTNGRWEANAQTNWRISDHWQTGLLLHTTRNSTALDQNNDDFLDTPLGSTYSVMNHWVYNDSKDIETQVGIKWTGQSLQGGQLSYDKQLPRTEENGYGVGVETNRGEAYWKFGWHAPRPETYLTVQASGIVHEQSSFYGLTNYTGSERYANAIVSGTTYVGSTNHLVKGGLSYLYNTFDEQYQDLTLNRTESVPGIFGEYIFKLGDKVSVMAGYRMDVHNLYGLFSTPRVHFRYSPDTKSTYRLSVGKAYRVANVFAENSALFVSSRLWDIANNLQPEEAINTGATWIRTFRLFNRTSIFTADYYHTWFQNQVVIDRDSDPAKVFVGNLDGASGSDVVQIDWTIEPMRSLEVRMAYRYTWTYSNFGGVELEQPLVNRQRAMLNVAYHTRDKKWSADLTGQYYGSARLPKLSDNPEAALIPERSDDYVQVFGQVTRVFGPLSVYVGMENMTSYTQTDAIISAADPFGPYFDASVIYAPLMGRRMYAGLRYTLK